MNNVIMKKNNKKIYTKKLSKLYNIQHILKSFKNFKKEKPFNYAICDNFLDKRIINKISNEIPKYNDKIWHVYKNPVENKKTLNSWNFFQRNIFR